MNVLVEGPDCTGKTTLCEDIASRGFNYIHLSKTDDVNELYVNLTKELDNNYNNVIDRAVISNKVYQTVFGDGEIVRDDIRDEFLLKIDLIIICLPRDKKRYLRFFNKTKSIRSELYDNMNDIYDEFERSFNYDFLKGIMIQRYDLFDHMEEEK